MDTKEAKFVLQSFRSDGQDSGSSDFQEALKLALEDRELGEWLVAERSRDSQFAEALESVKIPEDLRENILTSMASQVGDMLPILDDMDQQFADAFLEVSVPTALREEIISGVKQGAVKGKASNVISLKNWIAPFAAAAAITVAFILTKKSESSAPQVQPLAVTQVQQRFDESFSRFMSLDKKSKNAGELFEWVQTQELPLGEVVPTTLQRLEGIGCKELDFNGKSGSLVCLKLEGNKMLHLVVFKKGDIAEQLPKINEAKLVSTGSWNIAQWESSTNTHFLFAASDQISNERLATFF